MGKSSFYIKELHTDEEFKQWDNFVDNSPQGSIYATSTWARIIGQQFDTNFKILGVFNDGEIVGGMVLFIRSTLIGGKYIIRPKFTPYTGLVLGKDSSKYPHRNTDRKHSIIKELIFYLTKKENFKSIHIVHRPEMQDIRMFIWKGWKAFPLYTYYLPLENPNDILSKFAHDIRKQLKKCAKLRIVESTNIEEFYSLFEITFKRRKRPVPIKREKLKQIFEALKAQNLAQLFMAYSDRETPVAGRISVYTKHPVVHDWVAAADPEYFSLGANPCLLWYIIQTFSERGYKYLDLNGANIPSIATFKSRFGGELKVYFETLYYKYFVQEILDESIKKIKSIIKRKFLHELPE